MRCNVPQLGTHADVTYITPHDLRSNLPVTQNFTSSQSKPVFCHEHLIGCAAPCAAPRCSDRILDSVALRHELNDPRVATDAMRLGRVTEISAILALNTLLMA